MNNRPKTAFITGGASGIGRALASLLVSQGWLVFIADRNSTGAKQLATQFTASYSVTPVVHYAECDVSSWDSQLLAFQQALKTFNGRIDFVAAVAGIGEKKWIPFPDESRNMREAEFEKPDLSVVDVDFTGVLYTVALAVQQFRRQEKDAEGWRGKIGVVASVCGFYCVKTLPVYTAAKHGVVGLTRTYGKLLPEEGITLNAVCPNIVQTGISTEVFYKKVSELGLLTPMDGVLEAFTTILREGKSGEVFECGPRGGYVIRDVAEHLDQETEKSMELLVHRGMPLHYKL